MIINCPLCKRKMKMTHFDDISGIIAEEIHVCQCGLAFEYLYGDEIYTKNGKIIDIKLAINRRKKIVWITRLLVATSILLPILYLVFFN